jgi:hypothetical protein
VSVCRRVPILSFIGEPHPFALRRIGTLMEALILLERMLVVRVALVVSLCRAVMNTMDAHNAMLVWIRR